MRLLSHLNAQDWQQLIPFTSDEAPFQFLPEYTNFFNAYHNEPLYIVYSTRFDCYMPLRLYSLKMFKLGQILYAPLYAKDYSVLPPGSQLAFFNEFIRFLKTNKLCERLIQPHPYAILGAVPPHSRSCEFGTYVIDLANKTEEEIFECFDKKYQKAIIHSQKNGAQIKFGREVLDDFYYTYLVTMKRANIPADFKIFFHKLYENLGEKHLTPAVVYDNNEPIGATFYIHSKYAAFCTHAGSAGESKLYGAMKLLHFEMMKMLKQSGVKRYDLVGVRLNNTNPALDGIFRFKKGFGGDLKSGYLWKTDLHPFKSKIYDMLSQLKFGKKTFSKDIIDQVNG